MPTDRSTKCGQFPQCRPARQQRGHAPSHCAARHANERCSDSVLPTARRRGRRPNSTPPPAPHRRRALMTLMLTIMTMEVLQSRRLKSVDRHQQLLALSKDQLPMNLQRCWRGQCPGQRGLSHPQQ